MKFNLKSLVVAAAFVAAGAANAAPLTLSEGGSVTDQGWTVSGLTGSGTLEFSGALRGALSVANVSFVQVDPAQLIVEGAPDDRTRIEASAPVNSLTGTFDGTTVSISGVQTSGGASQILPDASAPNATDASTGGFVTITNLRVDLINNDIYATLIGGNGVGTVNNLKLWHINSIVGETSFAAKEGVTTSVNVLGGLTIYDEAFQLFTTSAGLTEFGAGILANVNNLVDNPEGYGTIRSSISVTAARASAVPEPSTYALTGLGLVAVGLVARRRKAQ